MRAMKKTMKNNELQQIRYSITDFNNGGCDRYEIGNALGWPKKIKMAATFENLISAHVSRMRNASKSASIEQIIRNHVSALNGYLTFIERTRTSEIEDKFFTCSEILVENYLTSTELSERSKSDRRGLLKSWGETYELIRDDSNYPKLDQSGKLIIRIPKKILEKSLFENGLRKRLKDAGLVPKAAARMANISCSAIQRWMNGSLPNNTTIDSLEKLDITLGIPSGELRGLLNESNRKATNSTFNRFRERQKINRLDDYRLGKNELTTELKTEWNDLFTYKTSTFGGELNRSLKGRWALADIGVSALIPNQLNSKGKKVCATADSYWSCISAFLGFLRYSKEKGGYGLKTSEVQTLAWLAVPDAINQYLEFLTERSDGLKHSTHRVFCSYVMSLTNAENGYLTQMPNFLNKLPTINQDEWLSQCKKTNKVCAFWKSESNDASRAPEEPIDWMLKLDDPLEPVFDAMRRLRSVSDAAPKKSMLGAIARRNELILGLFVANPLRVKNMMTLTYKVNNSGNLYRSSNGGWNLRIPITQFKNGAKINDKTYDVEIGKWLHHLIEDYVRDFRQLFIRGQDLGFLFLTSKGRKVQNMSSLIRTLTIEHIPGCIGFGPHAFRHLIATDWLKKNPNDFYTVANLLNDSIEVVIKHYAHLKKEVSFQRYGNYINSQLEKNL